MTIFAFGLFLPFVFCYLLMFAMFAKKAKLARHFRRLARPYLYSPVLQPVRCNNRKRFSGRRRQRRAA